MAVKKRPVSPRQKMINLMYIVLLAMLALNVSNDVLKGFSLISDSLLRTTDNAMKENLALYEDIKQQLAANPEKVKPWFDKAHIVKTSADSLYNLAERLRIAIAREADGKHGNPDNLENKEDLEASSRIMLAPVKGYGRKLYDEIGKFRTTVLQYVTDPRQRAILASNLSTDVPGGEDNIGKNWEQYMFEQMPAIAAVTMLAKLQSDVRKAENEVLHTLVSNIDIKDIRVNELNAYCLPEATTLFPGETFRSHIFMAAVDTTQRPEIYVNGKRIAEDGSYNFTVGSPGEYSFNGYIMMPNAAGEIIRRDFVQKYNVIAPPMGATVAADLMNVLYAGFENPVSVSASGVSPDKISLAMADGRGQRQAANHGRVHLQGAQTARPHGLYPRGRRHLQGRQARQGHAAWRTGHRRGHRRRPAQHSFQGAEVRDRVLRPHGQRPPRNVQRRSVQRQPALPHARNAPRLSLLHHQRPRHRPRRHSPHLAASLGSNRELI